MPAILALPASGAKKLLARPGAAWWALAAATLLPLLLELALAERKYALFGGGFGQSQTLDQPIEIAVFLVTLAYAQALLFYLLYRGVRRLHGRNPDRPIHLFNFVFFIGLGATGIVIAKYQALSYFSDAMSFQIVRNLGGGSLSSALLYVLDEASLAAAGIGGAILVYAASRWLLRPMLASRSMPVDEARIGPRQLALAIIVFPLLLFAANRVEDSRAALARFNSIIAASSLLHLASDFDRDGYSFYSHPIDLHPFDSARHPFALDIPGNGIDEDGYGGDLVLGPAIPDLAPAMIAGRKRHVILIVLESARADMLAMKASGTPVTPTLKALARRGSHSAMAYSHVGFTTQSIKSLFTGKLAPIDDRQSLVRDFLANDYRVGIFSGQAEDFGDTAEVSGMRRGQIFIDGNVLKDERSFGFGALASVYVDGRKLLREFDRHLGRPEAWTRPHFLYFNFQSAHFPYSTAEMDRILIDDPIPRGQIKLANRDWVARTYWNALAYNDRLVTELMERLERLGIIDDSLIIVTADHGESLFDDGFLGHGHMLNAQQTRIPFILSDPGIRLDGPIGLADMRQIILRAAGAEIPERRNEGVLQYLGTLDRPGQIGMIGGDGRQIIFDLNRESIWSSASGRWTRYRDLEKGSAKRSEAEALIDLWARERWFARQGK